MKPDSCKVCPLYDSVEGPVWGEGPPDATEMHVGEGPGEVEGITKKPFQGGSGRVLNALYAHAGVDRKKLYITNVVKCRPTAIGAAGKPVDRIPTETEIRCCARFLKDEIHRVNPNLIVALGNVALHTLTDYTQGILKMRSVPLEGPKRTDGKALNYKLIGTVHPAGVMRQQHLWPAVVYDLVRAKREGAFPEIKRRKWASVIHAYLPDVRESLLRSIKEPRIEINGKRYGAYFHDLETTGLNGRRDAVRCIGISAGADTIYCFDWTADVIEFVRQIHADPDVLTVGQNSEQFDIYFQEDKGFEFNGPSYDTLHGHHLLNSALPKDLAFIGATSTDEVPWKNETMYKSGEDALQAGCCKDVHATARGFEDQMEEFEQYPEQRALYFSQIMPLQPVLRKMSKRGLKKDKDRALRWHVALRRKADEYEIKLKRALGDSTFNVDSPKQLMDLLYKKMGLPIQYKPDRERGMRPSVDADALDNLALVTQNPIFKLVRTIRTYRKWDATFILCDHDEQYFTHPRFGSAKAATGRLNSWEPNMQNWPNEVRDIIIPDTGDYIILSRDWSGIEWRIAMTLSGDRNGLDALAAGRDPHSDSYALAFGTPYEEVTKGQRFEAKTINYGFLYGRSNESLAAGRPGHPESAMDITAVDRYTTAIRTKLSGYFEWRDSIRQQVLKQYWYATTWGRRRWWYTRQQLPEAFNFPMQGNAAHMMYIALIEIDRQLPQGATLRASVHDECVAVVHKDVAKLADECMRDVMESPSLYSNIHEHSRYPNVVSHYWPGGWYCPSDGNVGNNWRQCKPDTQDEKAEQKRLKDYYGLVA